MRLFVFRSNLNKWCCFCVIWFAAMAPFFCCFGRISYSRIDGNSKGVTLYSQEQYTILEKKTKNPQNRNYYNPSYSLWFNLNHKFTIINYFPLKRATGHESGTNLAQIKCTTVLFQFFFCWKMAISFFGRRNDKFLEFLDFEMSNQYPSILWLLSNNKYPYCRAHLPFLIWNHAKIILCTDILSFFSYSISFHPFHLFCKPNKWCHFTWEILPISFRK